MTIETLVGAGVPLTDARSKSWDEFANDSAPAIDVPAIDVPAIDVVVTVYSNAANETCPLWPGHPVQVHWGFPDPAARAGDDDEKRSAFQDVFAAIQRQIRRLLELPDLDTLEGAALKSRLRAIAPPQE